MNSKFSRIAFYAAGALTLNFATPSYVRAADTYVAAGDQGIEQVVVTARRREERLQDVPISITVFNQKQLTDRNIVNASDLGTYTPSLSVDSQFGSENTSFSIRGFSQALQTTSTVGVYFDDVVAPRGGPLERSGDGAGPGSFFDLQNVQVLKGPQGTLFGRNTTGGAILLVPQKPQDDYEGYLEGSLGSYDLQRVQGVLNVPLNDDVRFRLGVDRETRAGYLDNISGIGPSHFNDIDYVAGRASLVVDVLPDLENYTVASYGRWDENGQLEQPYYCDPTFPAADHGGSITTDIPPLGAMACNQVARIQGRGPFAVDNALSDPRSFNEQWQIINTATWQATDNLTIKNITSYAQLKNIYISEIFGDHWTIPGTYTFTLNGAALTESSGALAGTPVALTMSNVPPGKDTASQSTFTEELQFHGDSLDNRLTWTFGGYLEVSNPQQETGARSANAMECTNLAALQCFDPLGDLLYKLSGTSVSVGSIGQQLAGTSYRNVAGYGQADYKLTDELTLTAGLRYTSDDTRSTANRYNFTFSAPTFAIPQANCFSALATPPILVPPYFSGCEETFRQHSHAPTWLIDLQYVPTEAIMAYAKYSRGYRQGAVQAFAPDGQNTFKPEHVDSYEVGAKTTFDAPITTTFDIAAFYNDFTNQQLLITFEGPAVSPTPAIENAGKSRIWGFEMEATVRPFESLTLDANYTYLNSKLQQIAGVTLPPGGLYTTPIYSALAGDPLPLTPENKASVSASYMVPLDDQIGKVSLGAIYSYTDSQLVSSQFIPNGGLPAYGLLDFNVDWDDIAGKPVDAEFFITNATDKLYLTNVTSFITKGSELGPFATRAFGEPRMFGFRVRIKLEP